MTPATTRRRVFHRRALQRHPEPVEREVEYALEGAREQRRRRRLFRQLS